MLCYCYASEFIVHSLCCAGDGKWVPDFTSRYFTEDQDRDLIALKRALDAKFPGKKIDQSVPTLFEGQYITYRVCVVCAQCLQFITAWSLGRQRDICVHSEGHAMCFFINITQKYM